MFIIRHRAIFFTIAAVLMAASFGALAFFGLRPSIEFVGGTLLEVHYTEGLPSQSELEGKLDTLSLGAYSLRPFGDNGYLMRVRALSDDERNSVLDSLKPASGELVIQRENNVGPTIGSELRNKAFVAFAVIIALTILYVAFAFRHVSEPVSSWKYGLIAIFALIHDITIPLGVFAVAGHFLGTVELDALFVTALLTILGYSVNDTIVIFDRIRENLSKNQADQVDEPFDVTIGRSLEQTFVRSFNTSVTVLIVVLAILFFGGSATRYFALALTAGVVAGTYSSLFLAAPLLVVFERFAARNDTTKA